MVLVTGITGSGKSTTLAAMIDFMNRTRNDHIVTIEDPVEFVHEDKKCVISQREIGQDSTSFAQALRAALRQDPDVILVGEMRDAETMEVALHAAETGHLVLSTLHTLNATETINRIISIFPPHQEDQIRAQLSAVLQGVVSQRLVVRADGKGRVPAVEVMMVTGLIRESHPREAKTPQIPTRHRRGQAQYGMQTFDQSLLGLYREELVTYETARDAATNPDDFDLKVKGIFSTGEMTWESAQPRLRARRRRAPSAAQAAARPPSGPETDAAAGPPPGARAPGAAGAGREGRQAGGLRPSRPQILERPRADRAAPAPRSARRDRPRGRRRARLPRLRGRRLLRALLGRVARARRGASAAAVSARSSSRRALPRDVAAAAVAAAFEEAPEARALPRGRSPPAAGPRCGPAARGRRRGCATTSLRRGYPGGGDADGRCAHRGAPGRGAPDGDAPAD